MSFFFVIKTIYLVISKQSIFNPAQTFLVYSLFSPCCCFLSRYVQIFSMVNVCIVLTNVRLHIRQHIVHLMQMVSSPYVLIILKANVFVKHANIFIHLNILLHNSKQLKHNRQQLLPNFFPHRQLLFNIHHQLFNWFILLHWTVVSRYWLDRQLPLPIPNKHLQHVLLPRLWYASYNPARFINAFSFHITYFYLF